MLFFFPPFSPFYFLLFFLPLPQQLSQLYIENTHRRKGKGKRKKKRNTNKSIIGVKSFEVSLEKQTAEVVADEKLTYERVLRTIAKTGKKINSAEADGVPQSIEVPAE